LNGYAASKVFGFFSEVEALLSIAGNIF